MKYYLVKKIEDPAIEFQDKICEKTTSDNIKTRRVLDRLQDCCKKLIYKMGMLWLLRHFKLKPPIINKRRKIVKM